MKAIWIIDDDKSIRWVFEKALARTDLNFKTFSSIKEALGAIKDEEPQVIVSDIRMPQGSGLELLQVIKEKYAHIPVIIMTAYSDLESAVAAFQGGAFEYLAKPFVGGFPLCIYCQRGGNIISLPFSGFILLPKTGNSVSPPSKSSFKYTMSIRNRLAPSLVRTST